MIDIRSGNHGEVDVVDYIVDKLGFKTGHVVEIGAWDGIMHSNINHLIKRGWSSTLIEMDNDRFCDLSKNMEQYGARCLCACVSLEPHCSINDIVEDNFDLFSLDIDGNDYWIWKDLNYKPAIVIVEYNSNWADEVSVAYDANHRWDGSQFFGASASALRRLGNDLGYDLVGFVKHRNLFFVRKDINVFPTIDDLAILLKYPHHREMIKKQKMSLVYDPHLCRIHLGCGKVHIPGFVNIDIKWQPGVDEVADVRYLSPRKYPPESADLIYASHVLEHFNRWEYASILSRWHNILKIGGIIRLAVPDFIALTDHYAKKGVLSDIIGLLYGGQDYRENRHYWIWDFASLKSDLESIGFKDVREWNWKNTNHSHIDDLSQAHLPHMNKKNGRLVSLNVEATK